MLELNLKNKWILSLDVSISSGEITFLNCNDESSNTIMLDEEKKISKSLLPQIQDTIKKLNLNRFFYWPWFIHGLAYWNFDS